MDIRFNTYPLDVQPLRASTLGILFLDIGAIKRTARLEFVPPHRGLYIQSTTIGKLIVL